MVDQNSQSALNQLINDVGGKILVNQLTTLYQHAQSLGTSSLYQATNTSRTYSLVIPLLDFKIHLFLIAAQCLWYCVLPLQNKLLGVSDIFRLNFEFELKL